MARYTCERCKQESNTLDPPHLCKDVEARLRRREKQVAAVVAILIELSSDIIMGEFEHPARRIVSKLNQMGVEDDG